jgi:hypothetical protein
MPSLQEQEVRTEHRTWIGGRALTLLNHYWREDDPEEMTGAIGADWADVLEHLPQYAIQKACIRYLRMEPRRKPTPGAICALAGEILPSAPIVRIPYVEPRSNRKKCSPEVVAAILKEAGYSPKKFGGGNDV